MHCERCCMRGPACDASVLSVLHRGRAVLTPPCMHADARHVPGWQQRAEEQTSSSDHLNCKLESLLGAGRPQLLDGEVLVRRVAVACGTRGTAGRGTGCVGWRVPLQA